MDRTHYALIVVAACGRIHFDELRDAPPDACTYGPFGTPVELAEIDSTANELGPWLSDDQLDIYFASERAGGSHIYHAHRASPAVKFDPPVLVDLGLSGQTNDPFITADGLTFWFVFNPTGAMTDNALYFATRASTSDAFANPQPATELNSPYGQSGPALTADALTIVFTSERPGDPGAGEVYRATRSSPSAMFGAPAPIAELSTPAAECCPSPSADASALLFASDGLAPQQRIVISQRVAGLYQPPTVFDQVLEAATGYENDPNLTYDGTVLVYTSTRSGGTGGQDIYFAERSCLP